VTGTGIEDTDETGGGDAAPTRTSRPRTRTFNYFGASPRDSHAFIVSTHLGDFELLCSCCWDREESEGGTHLSERRTPLRTDESARAQEAVRAHSARTLRLANLYVKSSILYFYGRCCLEDFCLKFIKDPRVCVG
jgi:hypothetical protein